MKTVTEDQSGFRNNKGTQEAILYLRNIIEKICTVNQKGIYCLCRLTESFWQGKLESNEEDTKDH